MTSRRLLHVEDDEALRRFVEAALEQAGYIVDGVPNGLEALEALRRDPDAHRLVILDLVLPGLNGLELLATLRANPTTRDLPVLVTTGTFITANEFGRDPKVSVLRKPFDDQRIVAAVDSMLDASTRK